MSGIEEKCAVETEAIVEAYDQSDWSMRAPTATPEDSIIDSHYTPSPADNDFSPLMVHGIACSPVPAHVNNSDNKQCDVTLNSDVTRGDSKVRSSRNDCVDNSQRDMNSSDLQLCNTHERCMMTSSGRQHYVNHPLAYSAKDRQQQTQQLISCEVTLTTRNSGAHSDDTLDLPPPPSYQSLEPQSCNHAAGHQASLHASRHQRVSDVSVHQPDLYPSGHHSHLQPPGHQLESHAGGQARYSDTPRFKALSYSGGQVAAAAMRNCAESSSEHRQASPGVIANSCSYDTQHNRFSLTGAHALDVFFSPDEKPVSMGGALWLSPSTSAAQDSSVENSPAHQAYMQMSNDRDDGTYYQMPRVGVDTPCENAPNNDFAHCPSDASCDYSQRLNEARAANSRVMRMSHSAADSDWTHTQLTAAAVGTDTRLVHSCHVLTSSCQSPQLLTAACAHCPSCSATSSAPAAIDTCLRQHAITPTNRPGHQRRASFSPGTSHSLPDTSTRLEPLGGSSESLAQPLVEKHRTQGDGCTAHWPVVACSVQAHPASGAYSVRAHPASGAYIVQI